MLIFWMFAPDFRPDRNFHISLTGKRVRKMLLTIGTGQLSTHSFKCSLILGQY